MLKLDQDLPAGALLNAARTELRAALAPTSALWFEGVAEAFEIDPDTNAVMAWTTQGSDYAAIPTNPAKGNGRLAQTGGLVGLQCKSAEHSGLVAQGITPNASRFTMAVIYQPPANEAARTLLTLNTSYNGGDPKDANYLFLSDGADFFTVKDTANTVELTTPVASNLNQPRMAIVTLSGAYLAFAENLDPPAFIKGNRPGMEAGADLFIGCRSQRKGLQKTLGAATILDVMFWPDHTLLLSQSPEDDAQYLALKRYFLWEY